MLNPYEVLGVPNGSSKEVCKKAYRRLCIKHHPDNGGNKDTFDKISKAWTMIESGTKSTTFTVKQKRHLSHISLFKFCAI